MVSLKETIEVKASPLETSGQKAEFIALVRALELSKGKQVNIYTDSKHAFLLHMHGSIWKKRGLLTTNIKDIKHKPEILDLLQAILGPKQVTGIHCPEHPRENTATAKGKE